MPHSDLLDRLPDIPRWVYVRGMLSSGRGGPVGPVTIDPLAAVALQPSTGLAVVVGRPPVASILSAAAGAEEILASPEDAAWVRSALPGWESEPATLYLLPERWSAPVDAHEGVRILSPGEVASREDLTADLVEELRVAAASGIPIGGATAEGAAVSFCYADCVTEGLWDVSIETIPSHRRRGLARRVALFMIGFYARLGKRAVWGSAASNPASAGLAKKLGFEPVDALSVFTRTR